MTERKRDRFKLIITIYFLKFFNNTSIIVHVVGQSSLNFNMRDISFNYKIINAWYLHVFKYTQKFNCKMVSVILVILFLEVWTLPNRFLVLMLSLMLPLKVWTWETESAEHISSGVHCLESDEWSPVTTFAVAKRIKKKKQTLHYKATCTNRLNMLQVSFNLMICAWHGNSTWSISLDRVTAIIMYIHLSSY